MKRDKSPLLNKERPKGRYREQYGVVVICENEKRQEEIFKALKTFGLKLRVVVT